jgi:hypothetical protein
MRLFFAEGVCPGFWALRRAGLRLGVPSRMALRGAPRLGVESGSQRPTAGGDKSSLGDAKSSLGDAESSLGGVPSVGVRHRRARDAGYHADHAARPQAVLLFAQLCVCALPRRAEGGRASLRTLPLPSLGGEQHERRHRTGRERIGSHTLQTRAFQTLTWGGGRLVRRSASLIYKTATRRRDGGWQCIV